MNPEDILAAMAAVYATCPTYRDAGRVVTLFASSDGDRHSQELLFQTAFVRPDRMRFEFRKRYREDGEYDRFIVWGRGEEARTWWDVRPDLEQLPTLGDALSVACGVSSKSSVTVPGLLLPGRVEGWPLTDLTGLARLDDAYFDGGVCYRVRGRFAVDPAEEERRREEIAQVTGLPPQRVENSPLTLWIDQGTLLLRRVEDWAQFETFRSETATTYDPVVGVPIADDELRFDPPTDPAPA